MGYGWAAGAHIDAINGGNGGRVVAVCSSRPLSAEELSAKHGAPIRVHARFEDLLTDAQIDVVDITGYPWEHADHVIAAARAGKHVIVEKPLVLSLADLRRVEAAVQAAGVRVCVCFECRWSSQFQGMKAMVDRGALGRVHYAEIDYFHGSGPWYGQYRWNVTRQGGGSSLLSAGCHALDALLFCLGGEVGEVMSYATGSTNPDFARYEYPTTCATLLKFTDGRVGKCASVIDCRQPYYFHTHLVGSEGTILDRKFCLPPAGEPGREWTDAEWEMLGSGDVKDHPYRTQFDAFFAALADGREMSLTSLREAVVTHEVIFAAERSLAEGRPVKLSEVR